MEQNVHCQDDSSTCGNVHDMYGALQGNSLWDIHTENILRRGAIHKCKRAPSCPRLPSLRGNKSNISPLKGLQTFSYGCWVLQWVST